MSLIPWLSPDKQLQAQLGTLILHPLLLTLSAISSLLQLSLLRPPTILQLLMMVQ